MRIETALNLFGDKITGIDENDYSFIPDLFVTDFANDTIITHKDIFGSVGQGKNNPTKQEKNIVAYLIEEIVDKKGYKKLIKKVLQLSKKYDDKTNKIIKKIIDIFKNKVDLEKLILLALYKIFNEVKECPGLEKTLLYSKYTGNTHITLDEWFTFEYKLVDSILKYFDEEIDNLFKDDGNNYNKKEILINIVDILINALNEYFNTLFELDYYFPPEYILCDKCSAEINYQINNLIPGETPSIDILCFYKKLKIEYNCPHCKYHGNKEIKLKYS